MADAGNAHTGHWVRSTFCGESACVEAAGSPDAVRVRGADPSTVLVLTRDEWQAFLAGVRNGDFDAL